MSIRPHFVKTTGGVPISKLKTFYKHSENLEIGGRAKALSILANLKKWSRYNTNRDLLTYRTTEISAFLNFGCVSVREFYHAIRNKLGKSNQLTKQLYWRDFFLSAVALLPGGNKFKHMDQRFERIKWRKSRRYWNLLMESKTGFLLIDAAMEQIRQTGYMHNRVRMIVASFLVKNLLIDWRDGERWFWDCLIDADLANNSASWQWVAGSGADAAPYFRIFNPILQGQKFDPEGNYTKKFVPELKQLPVKYLFSPWLTPEPILTALNIRIGIDYPEPIVDHEKARQRALAAYNAISI